MKHSRRIYSRRLPSFLCALVLLLAMCPAVGAASIPTLVGDRLTVEESLRQRYAATQIIGTGDCAQDSDGVWQLNGNGTLEVTVSPETAGEYQLALEYTLPSDSTRPFTFTLTHGETTTKHSLNHVYALPAGTFATDNQGNEVRPTQPAVTEFVTATLRGEDYRAGDEFILSLPAGETTLTFTFEEQTASIRRVELFTDGTLAPYVKPAGYTAGGQTLTVEAEHFQYASDTVLSPASDRSSIATTPYHVSQVRLNTVSGSSWSKPGQWISWELPVEQDGYYRISLRVRQNITRGMKSYRRVYIDGQIPCAELAAFAVDYSRDWQVVTLGNDQEDFYFYLTAGTHTLTMEATMGETAAVYEKLEAAIRELNNTYLQIVKITGITPDPYRTYDLKHDIPELLPTFDRLSGQLKAIVADYEAFTGNVGTELSFLQEMAALLDSYQTDSSKIVTTLSTFNSNISTMSTLLTTLTKQPLTVDKLVLSGVQAEQPEADAGFWAKLVEGVKAFFASFVTDYTMTSGDGNADSQIDVWVLSGRDQANLIKTMIDDTFTPQQNIAVRLSLVPAGLPEAVMAGRGPDIALGVSRTVPIDMGARGCLVDLTAYSGFANIRSRFQQSAFNAYTYKNKVFAVPETQDFYMMYVRTDVLEQLNITPPETWDDLMSVITTLSQENMDIGIPQALIGSLLAQNGMSYYQEGLESTVFSTPAAYDVYADFIRFYRDYRQPYNYSAGNRFKNGTMPIVFDLLSFYNTMTVLAPELSGQWDILPLPGTKLADGTIARGGDATGTASVLFKDCENVEAGFAFLDWWSSAEIQSRYGQMLENLLGSAGRYTPANVEAFSSINWSPSQIARINDQRQYLREIPEIPGSYIISRNLTNLFLDVMNNGAILRESMLRYAKIMDDELARKQEEMRALEGIS